MDNIALVLGGTAPHIELINQLKRRGYYTILIDNTDNPPAKRYADEHIKESTLDRDTVVNISKERGADLIISGCVDQANAVACYAMERCGYEPPYSFETATSTTDKLIMKDIFIANGILTPRHWVVSPEDDMSCIERNYPLIVKPADSTSAKGITKVSDEKTLSEAIRFARKISRTGNVIVEEFIEGEEISAYFFVDSDAKLLISSKRICVIDEARGVKCIGLLSPANLSPKMKESVEECGKAIKKAFGIRNFPMFFQGIMRGDQLFVLEMALRVAGSTAYYTIKDFTGFDEITAVIDSYQGIEHSDIKEFSCRGGISLAQMIYSNDGIFEKIEGIESLKDQNIIENYIPFKTVGSKISNDTPNGGRIGAVIINADSEESLKDKLSKVRNEIRVLNDRGNQIERRDLYCEL